MTRRPSRILRTYRALNAEETAIIGTITDAAVVFEEALDSARTVAVEDFNDGAERHTNPGEQAGFVNTHSPVTKAAADRNGDRQRCLALAQTKLEEAVMWATKGISG